MRVRSSTLLLALLLLAPAVPAAAQLGSLPSVVVARSDLIFVRFVFAEAMFVNQLNLYSAPHPDAILQSLFTNTVAPGTTVQLDPAFVRRGHELIFGLVNEEGVTFFSGPRHRNPDNALHFLWGPNDDYPPGGPDFTLRAGVEDLRLDDPRLGGETTDPRYYDRVRPGDYNDMVFDVSGATAIPEPASMVLLGSGLAGLAAWRHRRRRAADDEAA